MNFDLLLYLGIAFLLSWGIWIPVTLTNASNQWLFWLAGFAPTLAALALTAWRGGKDGLRSLLRLGWRFKPVWYAISLLGTPLIMILALGLHMALGGGRPQFIDPNHLVTSPEQWPGIFIVLVYIFVFTALGEEIGWRGYALPRLQARYSPFVSSLLLGIIWALWHLPLFWIAGDFHQQLPVSWFMLQILGSTFLYTWMVNRTKGSVLVALLFHTTSNAAVGLLPVLPLDNGGSLRPLWLVVILLWILVGLVLWFDRSEFFNRQVKPPYD